MQSTSDAVLLEEIFTLPKLTPGHLHVIKRDGSVVSFDPKEIHDAITEAFKAVHGTGFIDSRSGPEIIRLLTTQIVEALVRRKDFGSTIDLEDIQDQVELALMRSGEHKVARAYVIYREDRRKIREKRSKKTVLKPASIRVKLNDGALVPLDLEHMHEMVGESCKDLTAVDPNLILNETLRGLYDGIPFKDVYKALQLSARGLIEKEPNYKYVAARLLSYDLQNEALTFLHLQPPTNAWERDQLYKAYFKHYIQQGITSELLNPILAEFDLDILADALQGQRDELFAYLGLQTLYDRYFIHSQGVRFELPQAFFMRVAMGLAIAEKEKEKWAIAFYNVLSNFEFMSSTPTLFNSGTLRPQLSSCFLTTVGDDLDRIYSAIKDNALLSKFAGGLGNDWTSVRAMGAHIKGTNGKSLGVVPFLNVANASAVAVNQGGKRKGAVCAYLETWHLDIEEFLELRKNTGDDRRRTHDMNTANWVPDLFMKRVHENGPWTLFSPDETPDLHDLTGEAFEKAYVAYEEKAARGEIQNTKTLPALNLWRKMLTMLFETGHPWITFKDACNLRSPQQHIGVIHSSNLCTEITLNTSADEIAVCNLGSINLPVHITASGIDKKKLQKTISTAIRMLDNVIDINYYTVPAARNSNMKHRPIGLGFMGFQDALYKLKIPYASHAAVEFADQSMEIISYYAIEASSLLAKERGTYESYAGSLWSRGILPIDSIEVLQKSRGQYLEQDRSQTLDWELMRKQVKKYGMRNSNVMAIAPTATISNICDVSQSIEPTYRNLYVKSNMSGEFTVINPYLVNDLKNLNLWDEGMINDLKYYDGCLTQITRIPEELKERYLTAFEIEPRWLIEAGSRRQKWLDQAQSLNLYVAEPSGKKMDTLYKLAWIRGLKTTYYMRSLGATSPEKSTITDDALRAVKSIPQTTEPKVCLITDPSCESCQ